MLGAALLTIGCSDPVPPVIDAGGHDAAITDAGSRIDAPATDAEMPVDAAVVVSDAGPIEDPSLPVPALRWPANGHRTGSGLAPETDLPTPAHPLRPRLVWSAVGSATSYEVQLASGCDVAASDCSFDAPALHVRVAGAPGPGGSVAYRPESSLPVSRSPSVGTRYAWRVRACVDARCSPWSASRYLDVGRPRVDFDGDGLEDVAMASDDEHALVVRYAIARPTEPRPALVIDDDDVGVPPPRYDASVASGDFDGDGFDDLAYVLAHEPNACGGCADIPDLRVFFGSADGLPLAPDASIELEGSGSGMGWGAVAGDVDADGRADLVMGQGYLYETDEDSARGEVVHVFRSSALGFSSTPSRSIPVDDAARLVLGDFDGDGLLDVAATRSDVFVPSPDHVEVVLAGASTALRIDRPGDVGSADFGVGIAAADLEGDGFEDVVVVSRDTTSAGGGDVFVCFGGSAGPATTPVRVAESARNIGLFATAGDLDLDGAPELLVPDDVYASPAHVRVLTIAGDRSVAALPDLMVAVGGPRLGIVLEVADLGGDGLPDLVVGGDARPLTSDTQVEVYEGTATRLATTASSVLTRSAFRASFAVP